MIHHYQVCFGGSKFEWVSFLHKSLAGWTFDFYDYYVENITRYLDNPYFQAMADIVDPYGITSIIWIICEEFYSDCLAYFDRYKKTKILQFQGADDEFFLPDSEVNRFLITLQNE